MNSVISEISFVLIHRFPISNSNFDLSDTNLQMLLMRAGEFTSTSTSDQQAIGTETRTYFL